MVITANDQSNTASVVYVNGNKINNPGINYNNVILNQHDEIAIVYGNPPSNIPSAYALSQGT